MSHTTKSILPSQAGNANKFLKTDGTNTSWAAGAGGGLSDGDYGDVTVSGGGSVMTIDNGVITAAKTSITGTPDGTKYLRDDFTWQPAAGGGSWGTITGTVTAQSDLMAILSLRV